MQHYQVPSAEYNSYINLVISLGLAEVYIVPLRASCSPNSPLSLKASIDQPADTCSDWLMISSQCRPLPLVCTVKFWASRWEHQSQRQQPCLRLLRKLVSLGATSSSMPVMLRQATEYSPG